MTNTPFTFDPSAGQTFLSKSRRTKSSHSNNGATIATTGNCVKVSVIPAKKNNRISDRRTISDICADATFAAETAGIKKWQARERGRELTLKIAAMLQANVAPVKEVLKDYQPDFGDRDEVVARIEERGYATDEETVFLRESTNWHIAKPMSPRMQTAKARVGG